MQLHTALLRCAALLRDRKLRVDAHRKDDLLLEAFEKDRYVIQESWPSVF